MVRLKGPGFRTELRETLDFAFRDYSRFKMVHNKLELIFSEKGTWF